VLWRWFGAVVMADASGSLNSLLLRALGSILHEVEKLSHTISDESEGAGSRGAVPRPEQSGA
jgi:hypothetical protein